MKMKKGRIYIKWMEQEKVQTVWRRTGDKKAYKGEERKDGDEEREILFEK